MAMKKKGPFIILLTMLKFFWAPSSLLPASNIEPLVNVQKINPHIRGTISRCFLRRTVALQLDEAQKELEELGLGLKITDAYRSLSDQKRLWRESPDNRYVANPEHGSRHNRGAAVDLRLIRLGDGKELTMPTTTFSRACHRNYKNMATEEIKRNCKLLELIMEKHGFIPLPTEWWHFDHKNWASYDVLDIAISDLAKTDSLDTLIEQKQQIAKKKPVVNKKKKVRPKKNHKKRTKRS